MGFVGGRYRKLHWLVSLRRLRGIHSFRLNRWKHTRWSFLKRQRKR